MLSGGVQGSGAQVVFKCEVNGQLVSKYIADHTYTTKDGRHVAEDVKGSIARIAGLLADDGINIATLRLTRKHKGGDAFMVIEVDDAPGEHVRDHIRALPWVRWTHRLDKVSA